MASLVFIGAIPTNKLNDKIDKTSEPEHGVLI